MTIIIKESYINKIDLIKQQKDNNNKFTSSEIDKYLNEINVNTDIENFLMQENGFWIFA